MGRTYNQGVGAAGSDPVPLSVEGMTLINSLSNLQLAYDPGDFDSNQFFLFSTGGFTRTPLDLGSRTTLWARLDPDGGEPAGTIYVWTQIGSRGEY